MAKCFVDTSGWAALAGGRENLHSQAAQAFADMSQRGTQLITTNWVLVELTALLSSPLRIPKQQQIEFLDAVRDDPAVNVVTIDLEIEAASWVLWHGRPDKQWTLVDCASFRVMDLYGVREALTADRHFEQAGFVKLLSS
jgi:predicted nucleic acid-binding protein